MYKSIGMLLLLVSANAFCQTIPLPEHPRPDFYRSEWQNLNGIWNFAFDKEDAGLSQKWFEHPENFGEKIQVPFPWGSKLSQVKDEADIAWYSRKISLPAGWKGEKIFVIIGASDWATDVWVDGIHLGRHEGGYMPFEVDVTTILKKGGEHSLVVRADDVRRMFTLYGKQGYGNARGIWQTVYMESRGEMYADKIRMTPDIDASQVLFEITANAAASEDLPYSIIIENGANDITLTGTLPKGSNKIQKKIDIPEAKLWDLEHPHLYDTKVVLGTDEVNTYFGMRKVSVEQLPGTDIPYIALNGQPVYLQLALDQAYHEDGFYTFPTDEFMKQEVARAKEIGLNGIRIHIKPEMPRKLYWADKLGLLVMADLPNSWGEPDELMQKESERTLRAMIDRDYNHPSIFSWIVFNETWGLFTKVEENGKSQSRYLPKTQDWVASMYYLAKSLDQSRLVEDNSICCGRGHTETDIMSWHEYLPGWEWDEHLEKITSNLKEGGDYLFEKGFKQGKQPNINSECGNVWGYEGSTGDVDWSYDYHRMLNTFRMFPQVAGWLYTEHHDVINEWNGYWRFDRTNKFTGFEEIHPGMSLNDLHGQYYISTGNEVTKTVSAGSEVEVPLFLSVFDPKVKEGEFKLSYVLRHTNAAGMESVASSGEMKVNLKPWQQEQLKSLNIKMPSEDGIALLQLTLTDGNGKALHRNFCHFVVEGGNGNNGFVMTKKAVDDYKDSKWSKKSWKVLNGLKVNGAGKGFFEYELPAPELPKGKKFGQAYIVFEVSAKQLFDKDKDQGFDQNQDYMLGSRVSPSSNPNSYPMTDETLFPSKLMVSINGISQKSINLADDPADHRGVLSWYNQPHDKKLREAGSYGYLVKVPVSKSVWQKNKTINLRLESPGEGGLALYGKDFGRYPIDIHYVVEYK